MTTTPQRGLRVAIVFGAAAPLLVAVADRARAAGAAAALAKPLDVRLFRDALERALATGGAGAA